MFQHLQAVEQRLLESTAWKSVCCMEKTHVHNTNIILYKNPDLK